MASTKGDGKVVLVFSICLQPDRCEILAVVVKRNKDLNIRLEIILETDLKLLTICSLYYKSGHERSLEDDVCVEQAEQPYNNEGIDFEDGRSTESDREIAKEEEDLSKVKVIQVQCYDPNKQCLGSGKSFSSPLHGDTPGDGLAISDSSMGRDTSDPRQSSFENSKSQREIGTQDFIDHDRGVSNESSDDNEDNLETDDRITEKKDSNPRSDSSCSDENELSDIECIATNSVSRKNSEITEDTCDANMRNKHSSESFSEYEPAPSSDLKRSQEITVTSVLHCNGNGRIREICIPTSTDSDNDIPHCDVVDDNTSCGDDSEISNEEDYECSNDNDQSDECSATTETIEESRFATVAEGKLETGRSVNSESLNNVQQTDSQNKNYSRSFLKSFIHYFGSMQKINQMTNV